MTTTIMLRGGRVLGVDGFVDRDFVVHGGRVAGADVIVETVFQATKLSIVPGFVDLTARVALRGRPDEERASTSLLRAQRAGFTSLVLGDRRRDDDTEGDPADLARALGDVVRTASPHGSLNAQLLVPLTKRGAGLEPGDVHRAVDAGAHVFGDVTAGDDSEVLRRSFELASSVSRPVLVTTFEARLARQAIAVEGPVATRLGLPAFPATTAEAIAVFRAIELARLTGVRLHFTGLSTARGLRLVEDALADGVAVSADVRPWSVLLDDEHWHRRPYDTALRVWPPLPRAADKEALADAVDRGVVAIGIGHSPPPPRFKALELDVAAPGADTWHDGVSALLGRFSLEVVARALSGTAARFGFGGNRGFAVDDIADATIIDTDIAADPIEGDGIFQGLRTGGVVAAVVAAGVIIDSTGKVTS